MSIDDEIRQLADDGYSSDEIVAQMVRNGQVERLLEHLPIDRERAQEIAAFYGDRTGEGSGALRYFARTGIAGRGLRVYLSGDTDNMPPRLAQLATYVRADAREDLEMSESLADHARRSVAQLAYLRSLEKSTKADPTDKSRAPYSCCCGERREIDCRPGVGDCERNRED